MCRAFEAKEVNGVKVTLKDVKVTLKEVSFIKLFCDAYFLHKIQPAAMKKLKDETPSEATEISRRGGNGGPGALRASA